MDKRHIRLELSDMRKLEACADTFGVIGDMTRLKICWLLCHHPELSVGHIAELLKMEISTVSHALRKLRQAGVVSHEQRKKQVFYFLEKSPMCSFIKRSLA